MAAWKASVGGASAEGFLSSFLLAAAAALAFLFLEGAMSELGIRRECMGAKLEICKPDNVGIAMLKVADLT